MGTDTTERSLANGVSEGFSKNEVFILRINPSRKVAFYVHALILYSLFLLGTFGQQPLLDYLEKSSEAEMVEELLPAMRELAQQGKPAAAVWLLKHDWEASKASGFSAITDAALTGDPESMFTYGVLQYDLERFDVGRVWIEKAAAEGYPTAVRFLQNSDR
ncbi:hypothetical protein PSOLE_35630 [Pseudomonas oleovorans subsp. oleovorans]|uniref:Sel1 repeat family protein n=2 Tax=Ectopseudomonas oleovorans TaxID=301 RepID=A0A379PI07_ECTOL|nr:hypothetical protein [Pseudomonas aeruginosa]OWK41160.1 hypothetical protein PSOLE_35630 [Pseudomonas oleovorans subsp. oleovorans]SEJ64373.1 hypothetical protein SAMN05216280_103354 [Pseudomonas oleovorans]MCV4065724.1 hypothetical protein [Pseudomonas aeruginosa]MCV4078789.1 hypothetical protein [Pseudomonas aeruginosa]MCV4150795.1 hypothetical protein [Pseudomonas aeruginosa]